MLREQTIRKQILPDAVMTERPEHMEYVQVMLNKTRSGFTALNGGVVPQKEEKAQQESGVGSKKIKAASAAFFTFMSCSKSCQ